jgi:DNA-binding FrmR family transcriptional regulator
MIEKEKIIIHLHKVCGQIASIEGMLNEQTSNEQIIQQLEAIRGNIRSLEKKIISDKLQQVSDPDLKRCFDYLCKIS